MTRSILGKVGVVLALCGGLALAYSGFVLVRARLYQKTAQRHFQESASNAESRVRVGTEAVAEGSPWARFEIPRLKMDTVVVEGDSDSDLRLGPGHIPGTASPGGIGNVGIAGHRDTVFRPLRNVRTGDVIELIVAGTAYRYLVESTEIVAPERSDVLNPTKDRSLTLVTCFPFYYVGSAPKRFIVHAREVAAEQARGE